MKSKIRLTIQLLALSALILSACSTEQEKNHILITHSDQPEPTEFPANVTYNYIIEDGYELPKDNMMVTFKWKQKGSYNQKFWMYEVKKNEDGYTVVDTDYNGFYVEDITELGYSPVSTLTEHKGTFKVTVNSKSQYESVIGKHPYKKGTHQFEELLIKDDKSNE